jgi:hypothetical protein
MMTHSKFIPFMAYLDASTYASLKKFSKREKIPMSQLVREAINARVAGGDRYTAGFNDGIDKSAFVINANRAAQMRFPSGQSFGELFTTELFKHKLQGDNQ